MNEILAALLAVLGGMAGGLVGVGGGVLFVPAMAIFIGLSQVDAESTSLLMIIFVGLVGAYRQYGYGNLRIGDALWIGALSPIGVLIGVVTVNEIPQRAIELGFAGLALFVAYRLLRRALEPEEDSAPSGASEPHR